MIQRLLSSFGGIAFVLSLAQLGNGCGQGSQRQSSALVQQGADKGKNTTIAKEPEKPDPFLLEKEFAERIAVLFPESTPAEITKDRKEAFTNKIQWDKVYDRAFQFAGDFKPDQSATAQFKDQTRSALGGLDPIYGRRTDSPSSGNKLSDPVAWYVGWITRAIDNTSENWEPARRGSYQFLGIRHGTSESQTVATFRLILAGGKGVNYHDYILNRAKDKDGKEFAEAVDVFDYQNGETLSKALHREFVLTRPDTPEGLANEDRAYWDDRENVLKMRQLFEAGNFQGVLDTFGKLRLARDDQSVLILRLRAARNISRAEFNSAYEAFWRRGDRYVVPDPAVSLLAINEWLGFREYTKAMECVDNLDNALGEPVDTTFNKADPYLNVLRARVLLAGGQNYQRAERLAAGVLNAAGLDAKVLGKVAKYQAYDVCRQVASVAGGSQETRKAKVSALNEAGKLLQLKDLPKIYTRYELDEASGSYKKAVENARKQATGPNE